MAEININSLQKRFGATEVLRNVNLSVTDGEFVALVGPSGCGKSTLLRMIAGIEDPSSGDIFIGKQRVNELAPRDRNVAMVFQDYALYPHMTVEENIAFGLMIRGVSEEERKKKVVKAAKMLHIDHLLERRPKDLSGGQRQRVAMGRCLVREPQAFLYDEPLSNLDAALRVSMRMQIKLLHAEMGVTSIYVTHDQVEAMTMADRIVCMRAGVVAQAGTPAELYGNPVNRFVAGFIGSPAMNFLTCKTMRSDDGVAIRLPSGRAMPLNGRLKGARIAPDRSVVLGIRPEHLTDRAPEAAESDIFAVDLPVVMTEPLGADTLVHADLGGQSIVARCSPTVDAKAGTSVRLYADLRHAHLFDDSEEGAALIK